MFICGYNDYGHMIITIIHSILQQNNLLQYCVYITYCFYVYYVVKERLCCKKFPFCSEVCARCSEVNKPCDTSRLLLRNKSAGNFRLRDSIEGKCAILVHEIVNR